MGTCFSVDCGDCDIWCIPCCLALSACCMVPCHYLNACGQQQQPPQTNLLYHPPEVVEQPPPQGGYPGYPPHQQGYPYPQPQPMYR